MMRTFLFLAALTLTGCTLPLTGPRTYDDGEITFSVPAGWRVTLRGQDASGSHAFIESPGDAVVFIQGMTTSADPGCEAYAEIYARRSLPNLPNIRFSFPRRSRFSKSGYDRALREQFNVIQFDEEIPHTRTFHARDIEGHVYYVVTQAADGDVASVKDGFREILDSFRAK
jgi:hypothetical protein